MKKILACLLAGAAALTATADDAPLWLRNVAISPDGRTIAFTFRGDIYTVPVSGGRAAQLTTNAAYDSAPVWSPDGSQIAFMSTRDGSGDIFVMPSTGGTAKRLTTHSGQETPLGWLDSETVIFSAYDKPDRHAAQGDFASQVYTVRTDASRPAMLSTIPMRALSVNKANGALLYQDIKGYENAWRKHERSSSTGDIWLIKDGKYTKLTDFNGNDQNPVWTGDDTYVYLSEQDGTLNVYARNLSGSDSRKLTGFTTHPVRSLSAAADGTLAFSWDGEIYTLRPGAEPCKVQVSIVTDDYDNDLISSLKRSGATAMAVSPTGKEVAFVLRGDVYVTSVEYPTTKRITNTPGQERNISFSKDGRTLVYDSERDGLWQLFTTTIKNPDEKSFTYATGLEEKTLYKSDRPAQQPEYSPDGKKVAFLEGRTELRVIEPATGKVNTALDGKYNYSYSDGDILFRWSPDSRWLLIDYIGTGGWNNSDIAMVAADGSNVIDLTESGYSDANPRWALDGEAVTWESARYGMRNHGSWGNQTDVMFMALTPEAADKLTLTKEEAELAKDSADKDESDDKSDAKDNSKKDKKKKGKDKDKETEETKPAINYDFANRALRVRRLTPMSGFIGDYILSPEGDKLYYVTTDATTKQNLMMYDLREGETDVLVKGVSGGIVPDAKGENIFIISGRGMAKIDLGTGTKKDIEFEAPYDRHPSLEREYIYDHMLSQVKDKFYDVNLHGVDWEAYGKAYRKFLPYINNNTDFAILLSEILGELNASHTGGRYYTAPEYSTASLGIYTDDSHGGDGLLVAEVIPGGPLSTAKSAVKTGEIITAIDGIDIKSGMDYYPLLRNKAGERIHLTIKATDGKERDVTVRPISAGRESDLLYNRWVRRNQAMVDSLSNGRIGYVHVTGMDSPSFRRVYSELLGKYRNCEAVIVDTRWNGGGWLHNDIAQLLSGTGYLRWTPRGQYIGTEPYSQWTKPSAMLINESNYSDAHGTPWVYKTLGIGELIGAPVPGTMTAVWWETQIDPTLVFGIPQVTSQDMQGNVLENRQLNPDIEIYNAPERVAAGHDDQIATAVSRLLQQLDAAK
ncbi:MAG: S41 family peptidase [Bacteroidales bacterium]|nr:S41 family peptidase [Bacteroidales bacterium]